MSTADPGALELPPIPSKRYLPIGEVSRLCLVKPHVLRYWEQEFPQLNPVKRRGNRRYYQRHEVKLIRRIRMLLYVEGFTISGARARLQQSANASDSGGNGDGGQAGLVGRLIDELNEVRDILR
ncbi:MAG: MerR family transcriptional regulator [bacterium]